MNASTISISKYLHFAFGLCIFHSILDLLLFRFGFPLAIATKLLPLRENKYKQKVRIMENGNFVREYKQTVRKQQKHTPLGHLLFFKIFFCGNSFSTIEPMH